MNIAKRLDQYKEFYVYFCEPIKNNIMTDSNFIRILYSNEIMTLSGIYLIININDMLSEKYYNKYKCVFNPNYHNEMIQKIKQIEENLLQKCDIQNKTPQYKIYEQLKNGFIKIFHEVNPKQTNNFIIKISGIWETQNSYGVTYKFISIQN
jgi:hypothetical protein